MDEENFNWDDFDAQSAEYLNSSDYTGGGFETPDGQSWGYGDAGAYGAQPSQFDYNASMPQGTFELPQGDQFGFGGAGVGIQANEQYAPQNSMLQDFGGGASNVLSQIFNGLGGQTGKIALSGLGALIEGYQNKKKASSTQNIVQQQQARLDPFASQRPVYQQALQSTIQDPYSQPMVKDQVAQIARAQAIKDAAAGRRSNSATSDPAMLAAQAQIAQQYMNSLMAPSGANINPSGGGGLEALLQANNASINGYASPMMSALGRQNQTGNNNETIDALRKLLMGGQ